MIPRMNGDGEPNLKNDQGSENGRGDKGLPEEDPEDLLEFINSVTGILVEKVIPDIIKPLTLKRAGDCLGVLGKIWNLCEYPPSNVPDDCAPNEEKLMDMEGYVDEYQYLHLEAVDMNLTDVRIIPKYFVWLLSVDLSGNLLTNEAACPVTKLPNLVALRLNRNRFRDPYMPVMKHLQYLGLNANKIQSLHRIYHPNLETLDLNYNRVRNVEPEDCWKLPKLKQLELRGNLLKTTNGIEYATLVNLYLARNQITELRGMEILVNLQRLHLRENPLSSLSGFSSSNSNLRYLNVRKCQINEVEEIQNLSILTGLSEIIVTGNNFNPENEKKMGKDEDDDEDFEEEGREEDVDVTEVDEQEDETDTETRIQILSYLPRLKRIDKKLVTKEEIKLMKEMMEGANDYQGTDDRK